MAEKPVAIVTGASRGIGRAIALELANLGFSIAGIARTLESTGSKAGLNALKPLMERLGASFLPLQGDVRDIHQHDGWISLIEERFGRIDLLVNNAGVAPLERLDVLDTTEAGFDRLMSINLRGPFFLTQAVAKSMLRDIRRIHDYFPRIVFITSISAEVSSINRAEYCISKAGLSMAAAVFADRMAEAGIRVYEIRPGLIRTDMTVAVKEKYDKLIEEGLIPLNRWGEPEDVAKAVAALARGSFDYATGSIIELSGGMNIRRL